MIALAPLGRRAALLAVVLAATSAAGCAGVGRAGRPGRQAQVALQALERGDVPAAEAATRQLPADADAPAHLAAALLARRSLDGPAEARELAAAVSRSPDDPVALVALRRLAELADLSPGLAAQADAAVAPLLASGRLRGVAAYRARVVRTAAAEAAGDHAAAARVRAENGAVTAWTVSGPYALYHALDFGRTVPPEEGLVPESVPAAAGLPPYATRTLPTPDGIVTLEGEPADADLLALATEVTLARGGRYLLNVGTQLSVRVRIDGAVALERKGFEGFPSTLAQRAVTLGPGVHRLVVVATRGTPQGALHVALSRADGAASDARFAPAPVGRAPSRAGAPELGPAALAGSSLAAALEPALGPVLARVLAVRDVLLADRETAKALVAAARAARPAATLVRIAAAEALADDPTLDDRVARGRAEAELREALRADPGNAEARLLLAAQLRAAERRDDADEVLAALGPAADRPAALAARARAAQDRGLSEQAESLAFEALRAGSCDGASLALELAARRDDIGHEDEAARAAARCRGGRERLAAHLRKRGDPAGERAALDPLVAARPWAIEPGLARADALVAAGEAGRAVEAVAALAAIWPRSARVQQKLGDVRELAGDAAGARVARTRALALDGGNLALRRALALEDGGEVLQDLAEDTGAAIRAYEAAPRQNGASATMVLDAAAVEFHPGGTATERTHEVIQVHDQHAVEQWGEVSVPSGASVIALRTLKPDGRALEPERGGGAKGTISLAGLEPGDYLDFEWIRAVQAPRGLAGLAASPFYFQTPGARLFRSVYAVRAPVGLGLAADGHGMPAPPLLREAGADVVRAERRDVPAYIAEPAAPSGNEVLPFLSVGIGGGLETLQRGLGDGLAGRTRPTAELRALADAIRIAAGPGASPAALVRAAYARVTRDVLGQGDGDLAEEASAVLSRGRGSRLLVLKAVLSALGVPARLAFVRPYGADPAPWRFPRMALWSTPLLRVKAGGEILWLDPSTRQNPFGAIPDTATGCEALIIPEPGDALELDRTPARAAAAEDRTLALRIVLGADGGATIVGSDRYTGAAAGALKSALESLDATERRQAMEGILGRMFRGVSVTRVEIAGEDDPDAPGEIRFEARAPELARAADGGRVLEAPIFPARLGARYVQVARRRTPLLIPEPDRATQRIEIVAPPGLVPRAGPPAKVETPFGRFAREERVEGATIVRTERLELARGRISPDRYLDFARFAREVDEVQDRPVVFAR
ncbi:DUF3857 domain-containing protein [Anaeromyxobacter oryzisoli]|uniref:DUF3857 domain-containing protein n=1 Tax=Anaeromyxobacter oryzisoli TaxID=2925408 RepID=UPI001F57CB13|nr:DUF3857 domain-containing protein [Anaeromyxobacter sp. SG63]